MFDFPWSNFHELNLDWILSVVKEAKEIFIKGEGDIQHAVETADQALETAEQAAAGVIADGAVTIPKINGEVFSLLAYCVSGSVAPNFIPAGALVILRKSTIYNLTDGIYTATRNIPQAAIITAADLDQSATLYREGGMNYLLHNEEKLSGTIDLIKAGLVILVTGDEASAAIPADGLAYVTNNTHGLTEGFYFNSSGAEFPTTGGTADSDSFTAVNNILNALQTSVDTLGDALDALETETGTVEQCIAIIINGNTASVPVNPDQYVLVKNSSISGISDGLYTYSGITKAAGNTFVSSELISVVNGGLNSFVPDKFYPTLNSGLTSFVTDECYKIGHIVIIQAEVAFQNTTSTQIDPVFTIPAAYRPQTTVLGVGNDGTNDAPAECIIRTNGTVIFRRQSSATFNNLRVFAAYII